MDIRSFLLRRGNISLMALRSAYTYLYALQIEKRHIEYDDIYQGLLLGADLNNAEVIAHIALIYGEPSKVINADCQQLGNKICFLDTDFCAQLSSAQFQNPP